MDNQKEELSLDFLVMLFLKQLTTSHISAQVTKEKHQVESHSISKTPNSIELFQDSWPKVVTLLKAMEWEVNQFMAPNSPMRTLSLLTLSHTFSQWQTQVQTQMDLNSSLHLKRPHGSMADMSFLEKFLKDLMLSRNSKALALKVALLPSLLTLLTPDSLKVEVHENTIISLN